MNAIPGRYNKPDSTQVGRRAEPHSPLANVRRRRPLLCYKEPLAEPRSERLAVRLRVTPAREQLLGPQWVGSLAGSAVGTKECEKLTEELTQRRCLVLGETHTCERCRPVCRGAAIPSIDCASPKLHPRRKHRSFGPRRPPRFSDPTTTCDPVAVHESRSARGREPHPAPAADRF